MSKRHTRAAVTVPRPHRAFGHTVTRLVCAENANKNLGHACTARRNVAQGDDGSATSSPSLVRRTFAANAGVAHVRRDRAAVRSAVSVGSPVSAGPAQADAARRDAALTAERGIAAVALRVGE